MKYTHAQLEEDILRIVKSGAALRKAKGHDYAGDQDTFRDLRDPDLGVEYCLKRMLQKIKRALNLLKRPPAVINEKIESEFADIINFALYCPILYRQMKKDEKANADISGLPDAAGRSGDQPANSL